MFRTAEAAGWTREARYKTSFYSMLEGAGQTLSLRRDFGGFSPPLAQPRSGEQYVAWGVKPWVTRRFEEEAPKGRTSPSIPEIFFIHGNSVLLQKYEKLPIETTSPCDAPSW